MGCGQAWLEDYDSSRIDRDSVRSLGVGEWRGSQIWDVHEQKGFHSRQTGWVCREVLWLKNGAGESEPRSI